MCFIPIAIQADPIESEMSFITNRHDVRFPVSIHLSKADTVHEEIDAILIDPLAVN